MECSRPEYWSGETFPSPEDLPNPGIEPRSPTLQADSLPAEPQGKPSASKDIIKKMKSMEKSRLGNLLFKEQMPVLFKECFVSRVMSPQTIYLA